MTEPPTVPVEVPITDLQRDLKKMGEIAQVLESWFGARIFMMKWLENPRTVEIQTVTREDFNKCVGAMNLTVGRMFGNVESPLISATGEYNGVTVYLFGRAS